MANTPRITERGTDGVAVEALIPASQPGDVFPAGVMLDYAGAAPPTGWLLCDGSVVARATYPNLFSAIGTTFGAGDGSTTFGIPDTRGKVRVSKHTSGTFVTLGATGGAETVTLDITMIPSHNHGGATNTAAPNTGVESNDHTHAPSTGGIFYANGGGIANSIQTGTSGSFFDLRGFGGTSTGGRSAVHTHAVDPHAHSINAQGGGAAHTNLQPYIVLNHIIRAY